MKYGLEPVIDHASRILILGTLPGDESLRLGQYYSNPRNQFWRILAMSYDTSIPEAYENRIRFLMSRGLALWDVEPPLVWWTLKDRTSKLEKGCPHHGRNARQVPTTV